MRIATCVYSSQDILYHTLQLRDSLPQAISLLMRRTTSIRGPRASILLADTCRTPQMAFIADPRSARIERAADFTTSASFYKREFDQSSEAR
jgi:hypothetical protein